MPYWNFEYTKAVIYTVVKVGGGIGQGPATEVTHLRLNQPPVFPVMILSNFYEKEKNSTAFVQRPLKLKVYMHCNYDIPARVWQN